MKLCSVRSRSLALPPLLGVVLWIGACADAVSDPMAALMAQETRAAIDLGGPVPSLTEIWVASGGFFDETPVVRWEESWELSPAEGRALRAQVYDDALPLLYGRLGEGDVQRLLVDVDSTFARVDRLSALGVPERLSRRLDSAREMLTWAWILAEEGEGPPSLAAALQASDYLREVTPPHVAAQLLSSAEGGLGRISAEDSYSGEVLGRAARLIDVAREAIREGDYARAIRGSFYACVLLGVELPD